MISIRHRFLVGFGLLQVVLALAAMWRGTNRLRQTAAFGQAQRLQDKTWIAAMALRQGTSTNELAADPRLELASLGLVLHVDPAAQAEPEETKPRLEMGDGEEGHGTSGAELVVATAHDGKVRVRIEQVSVLGAGEERRRIWTLVFGGTLYVILSIGGAAWLTRRWLGALAKMSRAASQLMTESVPKGRLPVPAMEGELAAFASTLNALLDRLETEYASRHRFLADAAHELRTPLTALRAEIDVALRRDRDVDRYKSVLESNREELVRLSTLIDGLLTLARADAGEALQRRESTDLVGLSREALARFAAQADERGVKLAVEAAGALTAMVDTSAYARILDNLLSNALAHTPSGGNVVVEHRFIEPSTEIEVVVRDSGCGIPMEHMEKVFERFYRVDARKEGSAGLGLAIVKALVEAHGGRVWLDSELGIGTRVFLRLPAG